MKDHNDHNDHNDIEKIKALIAEQNQRFAARGGSVALDSVEGGTVKIAPAGFCWR